MLKGGRGKLVIIETRDGEVEEKRITVCERK